MKLYSRTSGKGKTLLMIHGIMCDHTYFDAVADLLNSDYKVITYDRRGYGLDAAEKPTEFSLASQAEDALEVISDEDSVFAVGHSAGSLVALKAALMSPEKISGMLLVEPGLMFNEDSARELRDWNEEMNEYASAKALKKAMQAFNERTGTGGAPKQGTTAESMKRGFNNLTNFIYGELNDIQLCDFDIDDLRAISVPVIIGITEKESLFSRAAESSAKLLGWPVVRISGTHNAPSEKPEEFAETIKKVLGSIENNDLGS